MTIILTGTIVETTMTIAQARIDGVIDATDFAWAEPTESLWAYHFNGVYGGCIIRERADFATLVEFAEQAADAALV